MKPRSIEEIEKAFREMGIAEGSWGKSPTDETEPGRSLERQIFIRIETTTTPLRKKSDADLA